VNNLGTFGIQQQPDNSNDIMKKIENCHSKPAYKAAANLAKDLNKLFYSNSPKYLNKLLQQLIKISE